MSEDNTVRSAWDSVKKEVGWAAAQTVVLVVSAAGMLAGMQAGNAGLAGYMGVLTGFNIGLICFRGATIVSKLKDAAPTHG